MAIYSDADLVRARQEGRTLAAAMGFSSTDLTLIATVISELARNIVTYARHGEIALCLREQGERRGITIIASDRGPGIPDVDAAVREGYSTSGGLGLGLPGVRRIVDEFHVASEVGQGTTVTVTKWARRTRWRSNGV